MVIKFIDYLGAKTLDASTGLGRLGLFFIDTIVALFTTKINFQRVLYHINMIGIKSWSVIVLTGSAVGAVLALQSYNGLHRFSAEQLIGVIVFQSMVREFGPMLSAIMLTGRAGSAMTAEIGTMRITEQIDALQTLCINTHSYLVVPRIIATTVIMPFLALFCSLFGVVAGYFISINVLHINSEVYLDLIRQHTVLSDITTGLFKATIFGFFISLISCYKGYITSGGAKGVGLATTQSVVLSNITVFISDYIITSIMSSS